MGGRGDIAGFDYCVKACELTGTCGKHKQKVLIGAKVRCRGRG